MNVFSLLNYSNIRSLDQLVLSNEDRFFLKETTDARWRVSNSCLRRDPALQQDAITIRPFRVFSSSYVYCYFTFGINWAKVQNAKTRGDGAILIVDIRIVICVVAE